MRKSLDSIRKIRKLRILSKKLVLDINKKRSFIRFKVYNRSNAINNEEGD